MKTLLALAVGLVSLFASGVSLAQNGNMMNGGTWGVGSMGEYGGIWMPILLVIVVAGFVAWIVKRRRQVIAPERPAAHCASSSQFPMSINPHRSPS